jgi:hypothetical protein
MRKSFSFCQAAGKPTADSLEQFLPRRMANGSDQGPETIEIDIEHFQLTPPLSSFGHGRHKMFAEELFVGQTGQRIETGLEAAPLVTPVQSPDVTTNKDVKEAGGDQYEEPPLERLQPGETARVSDQQPEQPVGEQNPQAAGQQINDDHPEGDRPFRGTAGVVFTSLHGGSG